MAKDLDKDELNDRDDPVPVLADDDEQQNTQQEGEADDNGEETASGDEYDIREDLRDDERDHVLGLLSDEELAALADEDDSAEDTEIAAAPATENELDGDDAAQQAAEPAAEPAKAQQVTHDLTAEDLAAINEAAKTARQEALDKWRDGDLTDDELQEAIDAAEQAKEDARQQAIAAKEQEAQAEAFERRKATFIETAKTYLNDDYPDLKSTAHIARFDRHVRFVTTSEEYAGMNDRQLLEAAHRLYISECEVLGIKAPPIKTSNAKAAATPPAAAQPQPKAKPPVVPTLARVPAAAANPASDGKFGALQARLDACTTADEAERLMASLSPEEREAFASADA